LREKRIQTGTIRPIRVDHTDFSKWLLKLIHSWPQAEKVCSRSAWVIYGEMTEITHVI
jgi:hypothetical protein